MQSFRFGAASWDHDDLGIDVANVLPPGEIAHGHHFKHLGVSADIP